MEKRIIVQYNVTRENDISPQQPCTQLTIEQRRPLIYAAAPVRLNSTTHFQVWSAVTLLQTAAEPYCRTPSTAILYWTILVRPPPVIGRWQSWPQRPNKWLYVPHSTVLKGRSAPKWHLILSPVQFNRRSCNLSTALAQTKCLWATHFAATLSGRLTNCNFLWYIVAWACCLCKDWTWISWHRCGIIITCIELLHLLHIQWAAYDRLNTCCVGELKFWRHASSSDHPSLDRLLAGQNLRTIGPL